MASLDDVRTALNLFTILLANELKEAGIRVNGICPGAVMTDMTNNVGMITADDSAKGILARIDAGELATGEFAQAHGTYPW